jgi:hypothetical protein
MRTTPVRGYYRGWVIISTPERVSGGWSAFIKVWRVVGGRAGERKTVPFSDVCGSHDEANGEGLAAGQRWIDEHDKQPRLRLVRYSAYGGHAG